MGGWHTVVQGEWVANVAARYGVPDWEKNIWGHPHNQDLANRRDPNILHPGDKLFIPEIVPKEVSCSADQTHTFVLKAGYDSFHLRILDSDEEPIKHAPYVLTIGNRKFEGNTDGNGEINEEKIARTGDHKGLLFLPQQGIQAQIGVGDLNPAKKTDDKDSGRYDDGISGIMMRLRNLGFGPESVDQTVTTETDLLPEATDAILAFQQIEMKRAGDKLSGKLDDETRQAIINKYGS